MTACVFDNSTCKKLIGVCLLNANCPSWALPSHQPSKLNPVLGTCGKPSCHRCVKRVASAGPKVDHFGNICHAVGQSYSHLCTDVSSRRSRTDGMATYVAGCDSNMLPYSGFPLTGKRGIRALGGIATTGWSACGTLLGQSTWRTFRVKSSLTSRSATIPSQDG